MQYIDVKGYADEILDRVAKSKKRGRLCIITMGDDPASASYVKGKIKDCQRCGIDYLLIKVKDEYALHHYITHYNNDDTAAGIIIQLPLPDGIDADKYTSMVRIDKDVDGFKRNSTFEPCTPEGIMYLLHKEVGNLAGKRALVIGRGKLVGKPMVEQLLQDNCTVTIAHSKTTDLGWFLSRNDIIISAAGTPGLIDLKKCAYGAEIVIDASINRDVNGKLCGDCYNFANTGHGTKVTPVPGGVGLMTRAMLMSHMVKHT